MLEMSKGTSYKDEAGCRGNRESAGTVWDPETSSSSGAVTTAGPEGEQGPGTGEGVWRGLAA